MIDIKHKNSEGFTLIELMAVLGILAIIAIIATPLVTNIIEDSEHKSNDATVSMIERSAEIAHTDKIKNASEKSRYSVKELVDDGYLDYDYTRDDAQKGFAIHKGDGVFDYANPNLITMDRLSSGIDDHDLTQYAETGSILSKVYARSQYGGIRINADGLKLNQPYVISYKYQKLAGTLTSFGGHTDNAWRNHTVFLDGKRTSTHTDTHSVFAGDDNKVHHVVVYVSGLRTLTPLSYFYIQPNRGTYSDATVRIFDFKLEEGVAPTAWVPATEG